MSMEIAGTTARISSGFRRIVDVFLAGERPPFGQILAAERIESLNGLRSRQCHSGQALFSAPRPASPPRLR